MFKQGLWRWPAAVLLPVGVLAGLFLGDIVHLSYEAESILSYKGELKTLPRVTNGRLERGAAQGTMRLIGMGSTPARAQQTNVAAAAGLARDSVDQKKRELRKVNIPLKSRQATLLSQLTQLDQERQRAAKGSRSTWTQELATRMSQDRARHYTLVKNFPTHTDIPILAQDIKKLEAIQRGQAKIDPARVSKLAKQVTEARTELSFITLKQTALMQAEKALKPDWTILQAAARPSRPVSVPDWPVAAGSAFVSGLLAWYFLLRASRSPAVTSKTAIAPTATAESTPLSKIPLALSAEEPETLPDDPETRKAAALYDRWLALVQGVYAPGPEAPKGIFTNAEPLVKETVEFLAKGQDTMTRHLARVVVPGDLYSHVARTVLMALMGAWEAGASTDQQQGMTLAALFHDLAVAPRPADAWHEIGSEVGRLSSGLLHKIPGIPAPLLTMAEQILIAMDEYPLDTWQNVPRSQAVASFAKLLGHIDRFDKVLQKQKTRLNRRIAAQ